MLKALLNTAISCIKSSSISIDNPLSDTLVVNHIKIADYHLCSKVLTTVIIGSEHISLVFPYQFQRHSLLVT